jgi:hypothetical protein
MQVELPMMVHLKRLFMKISGGYPKYNGDVGFRAEVVTIFDVGMSKGLQKGH